MLSFGRGQEASTAMGPDTAAAMELALATLGKVQALAARRWAAMAAPHPRMPKHQIQGSGHQRPG